MSDKWSDERIQRELDVDASFQGEYGEGIMIIAVDNAHATMQQLRDEMQAEIDSLTRERDEARQQLASRDAEITRLKTTIDEFYGIGTPYLDGFSESELERYSQMSPPEMFRHYLDATRERDEARAKLAQAQRRLTIAEIYQELEHHEYIAGCVDDGISPTLRAIWAAQKALKPLLPLRVPQEGAE